MTSPVPFKLSPLASSDLSETFLLWSDFETVQFTNWIHTPTLEECEKKLERVLDYYRKDPKNFGPYLIRETENQIDDHALGQRFGQALDQTLGQILGMIGADFRGSSNGDPEGTYEVWYLVRRDLWGQGICTRALRKVLNLMNHSQRVKQVIATAVSQNTASWRLLEKFGFQRENTVPKGHKKNGLELDLYSYILKMQYTTPLAGSFSQTPIYLETSRVRLRQYQNDDFDKMLELNSDPEVMKYLPRDELGSRDGVEAGVARVLFYQRKYNGRLGVYVAEHRESPNNWEFMGWFHLRPEKKDLENTKVLELGYRLKKKFWRVGYATEVSLALIQKAFGDFNAECVFAQTLAENLASRRVMEKVGMSFDGEYVDPACPESKSARYVRRKGLQHVEN